MTIIPVRTWNGKVLNYEEHIQEAPNKCDNESTIQSFSILGIPDLLSILDNDDSILDFNSTKSMIDPKTNNSN